MIIFVFSNNWHFAAHKWFNRHKNKDRELCERIIRRLILLSTGRWPYVLCKPLKSKSLGSNGKKINLYETKIDKAGEHLAGFVSSFVFSHGSELVLVYYFI